MRLSIVLPGVVLVAAGFALAHDVIDPFINPGQNPIPTGQPAGGVGTARGEFFADPLGIITVTGVTQTGDASCAAGQPLDVQFAQARGFAAGNGFILSNGYVDDFDNDGAMIGDPTVCAGGTGTIGAGCDGVDPMLAMALGTAYGIAPIPTEDRAILKIDFTASAPVNLDVAYEFATFELPFDGTGFYDAFGIFYDGTLLAGGKTTMAAPAGTDPWVLSPSAPGEYQAIPASGFHIVPANHTGLRTLSIAVTPGAHSVEFHVADGGPAIACAGMPTPSGCDIVQGALLVGLNTYESFTGALCGTATIRRVGHPAPSALFGGAFPADFQVQLTGAPGSSPVFFVLGTGAGAFPGIGSCGLFVDPLGAYFDIFAAGVTTPAGSANFPPAPPQIPGGVDGAQLFAQWFGIGPGPTFFNTKGLRILFGPP